MERRVPVKARKPETGGRIDIKSVEKKVSKVEHGFAEMKKAALEIVNSSSPSESFAAATQLYSSDAHQSRMVAVFIFGFIADKYPKALEILNGKVNADKSWQVQEILAQAFDHYCKSIGYENALPTIRAWLKDKNANTRRAATEGLRIWNQRDYFRTHPELALKLLSELKDDDSEYVRKSVGNAIRDISRKEKDLVRSELKTWDTSNPRIRLTYGLAAKFL
jgi:3-methyladenine DNA glycosylase AlkC